MFTFFYKDLVQVGGAERYLFDFFHSLKETHKVKIICFSYSSEVLKFFNIKINDIVVIEGENFFSKLLNLRTYINKTDTKIICHSGSIDCYLSLIFTKKRYDVILHHPHFNSFISLDIFSIFYSKYRDQFIDDSFVHDELFKIQKQLDFKNKIKLNIRAIIQFFAIKKSDKIFVLTQYAYQEKLKLFKKKSIVLPSPISKAFSKNTKNIKITGISNNQNSILFAGRLIKEKRVDLLIKLYKRYNSTLPKLKIIGSGDQFEYLNNEINSNNLNIELLGRLDDDELLLKIKEASLFITLEWADFNLTVYESIYLGTPVIFGKYCLVEEHDLRYIKDKMLFYTDPNIDSIYNTINKVMSNNFKRKKYKLNYNWDMFINNFLTNY